MKEALHGICAALWLLAFFMALSMLGQCTTRDQEDALRRSINGAAEQVRLLRTDAEAVRVLVVGWPHQQTLHTWDERSCP